MRRLALDAFLVDQGRRESHQDVAAQGAQHMIRQPLADHLPGDTHASQKDKHHLVWTALLADAVTLIMRRKWLEHVTRILFSFRIGFSHGGIEPGAGVTPGPIGGR